MRRFGLVGKKLSHSFSKLYFEEKFRNEGITDCEYLLYEISDPSEILKLVEADEELCGLNVTNPFKKAVIPYLDRMSGDAAEIGAVNTILVENTPAGVQLVGYNTDSYGFYDSLKGCTFRKALILGCGGAAAAVRHALRRMSVETITVSRNQGSDLIYDMLDREIISSADLIVNCTPLGMFPDTVSCPPIPYEFITERHFLYDLVYNPEETVFLHEGRLRHAAVKNGLEMLHKQAEAAWKIWNGEQTAV